MATNAKRCTFVQIKQQTDVMNMTARKFLLALLELRDLGRP
jgi:hypothetical protein